MRLGTSTTIGFNRPGGRKESIVQVMESCARAGYEVLDMNFHDCATFPTPLLTAEWQQWIDEIGEAAAKFGVEFSQSHLHFYEFIEASQEERQRKEEIISRCMKGSSMLGVKWAVTHAATAFHSPQMRADSLLANRIYFENKLEEADKLNLSLAIENLWDLNIAPEKRYTASAEELVELVDGLHSSRAGICWDFEHASIMEQDQESALKYIGSRLKATHVSDHYGMEADHQLPFFGVTPWESFLPVLREIGYEGDFVYETHRFTQNMPDELLDDALGFSVRVGEYLLKIIEQGLKKGE